ncbi:hypothetical protein [Serratia sp. UGAL515B_01]|uniref:hypothetical protein n=1 Tax=Serratia sp. UGAL515B_01 TaxID=2986763 RepID=UPI002953E73E|nr:hypothetical protein [Serratia sp. UGAL515B_01]WON77794.1 hypothetical protein OK023_03650 [Serratia sp. UGAL515B_01]
MDDELILNIIKSNLYINYLSPPTEDNIKNSEFTFALLNIQAKIYFKKCAYNEPLEITTLMSIIYPKNSNSIYYEKMLSIIVEKKKMRELLDELIEFRASNSNPQYGMIHSAGHHIDSLISILLFESGYYKKAYEYFEFLSDVGFDNPFSHNYKNLIDTLTKL